MFSFWEVVSVALAGPYTQSLGFLLLVVFGKHWFSDPRVQLALVSLEKGEGFCLFKSLFGAQRKKQVKSFCSKEKHFTVS